jgi:hypothetical protein
MDEAKESPPEHTTPLTAADAPEPTDVVLRTSGLVDDGSSGGADSEACAQLEFFSPELENILNNASEFQSFLNYLQEWRVDVDLLFVMQVDQLKEIAASKGDLMEEQILKIFQKHIAEEAELPLTQLPQRSLKRLRNVILKKEATLQDFLHVQHKVKVALDKNFVKRYLKDKETQASSDVIGSSESYIPTLKEVVKDLECLQLFVLFLMKESKHRMFLFWLELQKIQSLKGGKDERKMSRESVLDESQELERIYLKYVKVGSLADVLSPTVLTELHDAFNTYNPKKEPMPANVTVLLTSALTEMNKKFGRILRLELWPQFCKSQHFNDLLRTRREARGQKEEGKTKGLKKHRYSLVSLYKTHVISDDIVMTVPKPEDYFRSYTKREHSYRLIDYVIVSRGSSVEKIRPDGTSSSSFTVEILKHFPQKEWTDFAFPNGLQNFFFPEKVGSQKDGSRTIPTPPRLFNFGFAIDGHDRVRVYGACIQIADTSFMEGDEPSMLCVAIITRVPLFDCLRSLLEPLSEPKPKCLYNCPAFQATVDCTNKVWNPPEHGSDSAIPSYRLHTGSKYFKSPDFDAKALFRLLHPYKILSIIEYILLEKKVLLLSSQVSLLALAGETLRMLIYPFKFEWLYTPVLPRSIISALQIPSPYLIGIHSTLKDEALAMEAIQQDLYVVDLDYDSVTPPYVVETPFPPAVRTKILRYFRRVSFEKLVDMDYGHALNKDSPEYTLDPMLLLRRRLLQAWFEDLLGNLQSFVVVIPDTRRGHPPLVLVDAPAFFRSKPDSYLPFLKAFFKSKAFTVFLGTIIARKSISELCILGDYEDDEN